VDNLLILVTIRPELVKFVLTTQIAIRVPTFK